MSLFFLKICIIILYKKSNSDNADYTYSILVLVDVHLLNVLQWYSSLFVCLDTLRINTQAISLWLL